jgi:hypothetical protein
VNPATRKYEVTFATETGEVRKDVFVCEGHAIIRDRTVRDRTTDLVSTGWAEGDQPDTIERICDVCTARVLPVDSDASKLPVRPPIRGFPSGN